MPIENYVVDFACLRQKLVIEIDGGQHNGSRYVDRDRTRDDRLRALGFRVVRFWNTEVSENINAIVDTICSTVGLDPTPALRADPPLRGGRTPPIDETSMP